MAAALVLAILALQLAQVRLAILRGPNGAFTTIVAARCIFTSLALAARPLYLTLSRPTRVNELADPRLAFRDYALVGKVLEICIFGELIFIAGLLLGLRLLYHRPGGHEQRGDHVDSLYRPELGPILWAFYAASWLGRLAEISDSLLFLKPLASLAGIAAGLLIVRTSLESSSRLQITLLLFAGEGVAAFALASKTPLIAASLALAIRWSMADAGRLRSIKVLFLAAFVVSAFLIIQPLKGVQTSTTLSREFGGGASGHARATGIGLLERFDGFSAVTDAYFFAPRKWLSPVQFVSRMAQTATPVVTPPGSPSVGQHWTREVRTKTISGFQNQEVSLASGPTAEGYAAFGLLGVLLENLLMGFGLVAAHKWLFGSSVLLLLMGASVIFGTTLFELGNLGFAGAINVGIVAGIMASFLAGILRHPRDRASTSGQVRSVSL